MPAAPAEQPRPKTGVRFSRSFIFSRFAMRASTLGAAIPVTVTKKK